MSGLLNYTLILARLALLWERLWRALWPFAAVAAWAAALLLSGLLPRLPDPLRFAVLGLMSLALLWSLRPLLRLNLPSRGEALRRVETASDLKHRSASSLSDTLALPAPDPATEAVWDAHRLRQLNSLKHLKAGPPRPGLSGLDPLALRLPAGLALVAALLLGSGSPELNVAEALRIAAPEVKVLASADAWVTPPAYTGKPPVLLTSSAMREAVKAGNKITVPVNSILSVRVTGATAPELTLRPKAGEPAAVELKPGEAAVRAESKLTTDVTVLLRDGGETLESWQLAVTPDTPPSIRFQAPPAGEALGSLTVQWDAADDYGVTGVAAAIELSDTQNGELGLSGNGYFLFDAPTFPMALKRSGARTLKDKSSNDLSAHPWAGLDVQLRLTARDAAGQSGQSEAVTVKLPERPFRHPLARALVEQRKALIAEPELTGPVQRMLKAMLIYPQGVIEESGTHIAIAAVESRLRNGRGHEEVKDAIAMLWQIALSVEEGDLSGAKAALEAARRKLEQALAEGASPERIEQLMKELREAMNEYMKEMAEQARKRQQQQGNQPPGQQQQGREVTEDELQKMLDRIEKMAKNGANDAARQMLSELDDLLRNLEPGGERQAGNSPDSPLSDMLDELSEMMRRQQQLMDDTAKLPEGQNGEMGEDQPGQEPGSRGQRPGGQDPGNLADQQEALGRMLEEMRRRMAEEGLNPPEALGEAGKSMGDATGELREGEGREALGSQGEALEALRKGAQGMAKQLSEQQGQGRTGNQGRHGESRGDEDPLGRPQSTTGEDRGPDKDMLPGEIAARRAREILDLLRGRANQPDRPRIERDYLDRLLRGLY